MDELNLKILLLEEEMKFLKEQIESLKRPESNIYHQILAKYNHQPEKTIEPERKIIHNKIEYIVDSNNFLWDSDGYVCGWLDNNDNVILNSNKGFLSENIL
jgi:hypothetical protein